MLLWQQTSKINFLNVHKERSKYSIEYVSMPIEYSNLTPLSSQQRMCEKCTKRCDDAITMVRWRDDDGAKEHRFIVLSASRDRHREINELGLTIFRLTMTNYRCIMKDVQKWFNSKYMFVISSLQAFLHQLNEFICSSLI